jgi:hypothetical protein
MNNKSITDFIKPTIITAQQYGTKVSVEIDHSDTDLDELMDAFQTIIVGLGYHDTSFKSWVLDRADEYRETDTEELKEKLTEWQDNDVADAVFHRDVKESVKTRLVEMMEDDEQLGLYDDDSNDPNELIHQYDKARNNGFGEWHPREYTEDSIDAAIAEHNAHEEGFSIDGGFDGNPIKSETGTTYFSVPVNFYTDELGDRVYDYEGMADQFEEQLAELDKSAVVMVSVETQPLSKELIKAAKKYKKKLKTQ